MSVEHEQTSRRRRGKSQSTSLGNAESAVKVSWISLCYRVVSQTETPCEPLNAQHFSHTFQISPVSASTTTITNSLDLL